MAPSTWRQSQLRMHDAAPPGYLAEPTGMLLHIVDGPDCVTHVVAVPRRGAARLTGEPDVCTEPHV
ncbi:hypothetical protein Sya03_36080 [Spirilliplanes yamanashiensis]|uniref:Uncharacterized protein n=1 Tax=Spirilliplanes yamanashiensis TaxID=42233 RepID=A0A8J4DJW0_9ACTN|nr:hypothetical protein Sya03_36080 [Spirilliplanes yamanashiensis]